MGSTRCYNHGGSKARSARQWTCQKSKKWQPGRRAARSRSRESALPSQQRFHARRSARHEAVLVPGPLSLTLSGQPREAGQRGRALPHKGRPRPPGDPPAAATSVEAARTKPGPVAPAPPGDRALPRRGCPARPGHRAPPRPPAGRPTPDGAGHPQPPGNKARPGRGACAALGPGLQQRRGKSPRGRVLTGLRRSGCPGGQGGRGAESGPARSGRAAAAAPSRLAAPRRPGEG